MRDNLVKMEDYKNKNKQFRESYAVDTDKLEIPSFLQEANRQRQRQVQHAPRQERYTAPKGTRKRAQNNAKKKSKTIKNRIIGIGLAALVAFGGYTACSEYRDSKNTLTIEQALENGETLESLGINKEIEEEIYELQEIMEGDLNNQELIELAPQIYDLELKTAKTKLRDVLGLEEGASMKLKARRGEEGARVDTDYGFYIEKELLNFENTISSDIASYIEEIGKIQTIKDEVQKGDFDRSDLIKDYKSALEKTSKFAAGEMTIDDKGNIDIEKTRVSELESKKQENQDKGREPGD